MANRLRPGKLSALLLATLAILVVSARHSGSPWLDQQPDGLLDDAPAPGCLNCVAYPRGYARAGAQANLDADLDVDDVVGDPEEPAGPTAGKRNICDNIADQTRAAGRVITALRSCRCNDGTERLQLGDAHWPHHLNVVKCLPEPWCQTHWFRVPVLTHRATTTADMTSAPGQGRGQGGDVQDDAQDDDHGDAHTPLLPDKFRPNWRFVFKPIPVACGCKSSYGVWP